MAGTEPHAWGTGRMDDITYVGLDVHKATVCVAVAESGRGGEVRQIGVFENRPEILCKMAARLGKDGRRLSFCDEAGPCGYGLHRLLIGRGHSCVIVAPSLIPMKSGDRVKTQQRLWPIQRSPPAIYRRNCPTAALLTGDSKLPHYWFNRELGLAGPNRAT
jgi:transposase